MSGGFLAALDGFIDLAKGVSKYVDEHDPPGVAIDVAPKVLTEKTASRPAAPKVVLCQLAHSDGHYCVREDGHAPPCVEMPEAP